MGRKSKKKKIKHGVRGTIRKARRVKQKARRRQKRKASIEAMRGMYDHLRKSEEE